ncbi:hypothetical protein CIPAW_04G141600 [Carya illinoinensis]|uniref:Uncharacterized protein n=1 Tax=Carya illinoinensis TaxID=32201 RepID=A0A8T1QVA0_CARIL|nr:hypothetical protein CIPAW_04G141600 [Carya illinoinensis]
MWSVGRVFKVSQKSTSSNVTSILTSELVKILHLFVTVWESYHEIFVTTFSPSQNKNQIIINPFSYSIISNRTNHGSDR